MWVWVCGSKLTKKPNLTLKDKDKKKRSLEAQGLRSLALKNKCCLYALGAGTTMVVPIVKGYVIASGIKRLNFGGHDFTKYLKDLLSERSDKFQAAGDLDTPSGLEIVREIKEKILNEGPHRGKSMLYVAENFK